MKLLGGSGWRVVWCVVVCGLLLAAGCSGGGSSEGEDGGEGGVSSGGGEGVVVGERGGVVSSSVVSGIPGVFSPEVDSSGVDSSEAGFVVAGDDGREFRVGGGVPVLDPGECDDGVWVEDPGANEALVADCVMLAQWQRGLAESGDLSADDGLGAVFRVNWGLGPVSGWVGVGADDEGVKVLNFSDLGLEGPVPSGLGGLEGLLSIDLSDNFFVGEIPGDLGALGSLVVLDLSDNELVGSIPLELGGLGDLKALRLSGNRLSGEIPPELGRLSELEELNLGSNELSGSVPARPADKHRTRQTSITRQTQHFQLPQITQVRRNRPRQLIRT